MALATLTAIALFLTAFGAAGSEPTDLLPCAYSPVETDSDLVEHCAVETSEGAFIVVRAALREEHFGADGLAEALIDGRLHWVNRGGRAVQAFIFDNGADYFVEGLARTVKDGKLGFVDEELELAIPPIWDFALPFQNGFAKVCSGCYRQPVHGDLTSEHFEMVGGHWGYVDRTGRVVVPVVHEKDAVPDPGSDSGDQGDS